MKNNNSTLFLIGLLVVLVVVSGFLFMRLQSSKQVIIPPIDQTAQPNNEGNAQNEPQNTPTPMTLPYDYKVTNVTADQVIATAERGDITIRNDSRVQVFIGEPEKAIPAAFSDLKLGDMLILKRIPQVAAYVYIVNR